MDNIALNDLVANLGTGGEDSTEALGQTAQAMAAAERFEQTPAGQVRSIPGIGGLVSGATEAVVAPSLKLAGAGMSLANLVSGDNAFGKESMDEMAKMQYESDLLAKGMSNVTPNMPNNESGGNIGLELAGFMVGAGAGRKAVEKLGGATASVLSKMGLGGKAPTVLETLMKPAKDVGSKLDIAENIGKGMVGKLASIGEMTTFGTASTVGNYELDEQGNVTTKDSYGQEYRDAFKSNLAMGIAMEAGMALPKVRRIAQSARQLEEREASIKGSDEIKVNLDEKTIQDIHESTKGKDDGAFAQEVPDSTTPKDLWKAKNFGIFKLKGEPDSFIVSLP
jgi:hypothetical protein